MPPHAAVPHPARHRARAATKIREPERLSFNFADVNHKRHTRLRAVHVYAAARWIACAQQLPEPLAVRMVVQPRPTVHLSYNLKLLVGINPHRGRIVRTGLEIEDIFAGTLH